MSFLFTRSIKNWDRQSRWSVLMPQRRTLWEKGPNFVFHNLSIWANQYMKEVLSTFAHMLFRCTLHRLFRSDHWRVLHKMTSLPQYLVPYLVAKRSLPLTFMAQSGPPMNLDWGSLLKSCPTRTLSTWDFSCRISGSIHRSNLFDGINTSQWLSINHYARHVRRILFDTERGNSTRSGVKQHLRGS